MMIVSMTLISMKVQQMAKTKNMNFIKAWSLIPLNLNLLSSIVKQVSMAWMKVRNCSSWVCSRIQNICTNAENTRKKMARNPDRSSQAVFSVRISMANMLLNLRSFTNLMKLMNKMYPGGGNKKIKGYDWVSREKEEYECSFNWLTSNGLTDYYLCFEDYDNVTWMDAQETCRIIGVSK